ncbi:MAG: NADH-quinone oxidoreductase subunit K, partial [Chloroflexi bacterium]|nr:NADH-quinone oxidoreductase subunit K [Chloroflexota bacterium]
MSLESILVVAAIIFSIGLYGALAKRNAITVLMCIELMFNAVNITAVAMSRYVVPASVALNPGDAGERVAQFLLTGQIFSIFI